MAEFAAKNVFAPSGIPRIFYDEGPSLFVKNRAVSYYRLPGGRGPWHQGTVNACLAGGSGLKTCVEDHYTWDKSFDASRLPKGKYVRKR